MERIERVGRTPDAPAPVPGIRRLTPKEREDAARERRKRRRAREQTAGRTRRDEPPDGSVSLDIRA
jgi:hypothetical protein